MALRLNAFSSAILPDLSRLTLQRKQNEYTALLQQVKGLQVDMDVIQALTVALNDAKDAHEQVFITHTYNRVIDETSAQSYPVAKP